MINSFRCILYFSLLSFLCLMLSCNTGPKTQDVTLTYLVKDNKMSYQRLGGAILLGDNPKMKVFATVTNTSDYGGVFKFYAKLASQGDVIEFENERYIASGTTVKFEQEKEINPFSFEASVEVVAWGVIAPIKTIQMR